MAANLAVSAILVLVCLLAIFVNVSFIAVFVSRKRTKTVLNMFLVCLAGVDLLAVVFWTSFTIIASSQGNWTLGDGVCSLQVYFFGFCALFNSHILIVLMFERFLRVFKPSKHEEIFFPVVVLIILSMLGAFDAVLASFPLIGWGHVAYIAAQHQCSVDYIFHDSQLDFFFFWTFAFPVLVVAALFVAIIIRVRLLKKHLQTGEAIVLEENYAVSGDSYAERLKRQNLRFQNAGTKKKKPKIKTTDSRDDEGYKSSSGESSTDSENEAGGIPSFNDGYPKKSKNKLSTEESKKTGKKVYHLSKEDMILVHIFGLASAVYFSMWFLYFVMSYIYTHSVDTSLSDNFILAASLLTHFGSFVKPPLYMISRRNRQLFLKTARFLKRGDVKKTHGASVEERTGGVSSAINNRGELTTEL